MISIPIYLVVVVSIPYNHKDFWEFEMEMEISQSLGALMNTEMWASVLYYLILLNSFSLCAMCTNKHGSILQTEMSLTDSTLLEMVKMHLYNPCLMLNFIMMVSKHTNYETSVLV